MDNILIEELEEYSVWELVISVRDGIVKLQTRDPQAASQEVGKYNGKIDTNACNNIQALT
jgi:hypothetical protein